MKKKNKYRKVSEQESGEAFAGKRHSVLRGVVSGEFFTQEGFIKNLPFIMFLSFLGVLYIGNGYRAIATIRELAKTNTELKELRSEYITLKSELNFKSKQSQVEERAEHYGIKQSKVPPLKIELTAEEAENVTEIKE
jgi:cell division protein FtsL